MEFPVFDFLLLCSRSDFVCSVLDNFSPEQLLNLF